MAIVGVNEISRGLYSVDEGDVAIIAVSRGGDGDGGRPFWIGSCNSMVLSLSSLVSLTMSQ